MEHLSGNYFGAILNSGQPSLAVATLGFALCLLVPAAASFALLRHKIACLAARQASRDATISTLEKEMEAQALLARQMSLDLDEMRKRLLDPDVTAATSQSGWPTAGAAVNLNRRGQILRLARKGKSVAEIASDLNVAQGEVELLLKVHDLSEKSSSLER